MSLAQVRAVMRNMERLEIKEGDVLLVRFSPDTSQEILHSMRDFLDEAVQQMGLEKKVFCWLVPDNFSFETVSDEKLEGLNLYRVDLPLKAGG